MGSNRFYEHAQNLLGGVKRKWAMKELKGKRDVTIVIQNKIKFSCVDSIILIAKYIMLSYIIIIIIIIILLR